MSLPLVSICIPVYNGERFIAEAMNSAMKQTYRPLEIVVSDDSSLDNTLKIINSYQTKTDIPIKIVHHKPAGIGANWNNCVLNSSGEYIKFLFQDDLLEPDCIYDLMDLALCDKEIGLVFCKRRILYDPNNNNQSAWVAKYGNLHKSFVNLKPIQQGSELLKSKNLLDPPKNKVGEPTTILLKKVVFENVGYFNTVLEQSLDYEMYYRVFTKYKVAFVDKMLASFRLHEQQATALNRNRRICDYQLYPKLMYENCFLFLHPKVRIRLFLKYNRLSLLIRKIITS